MRNGTVAGGTVRALLERASSRLRSCLSDAPAHTADTPYLDAMVLLGLATGVAREQLLARMPDPVPQESAIRFEEYVDRRCTGEPIAYITGVREFFGHEFEITPAVLIPRPETELLVEAALELVSMTPASAPRPIHVHDTCTGSGCVAISIAIEQPEIHVSASDVSPDALEVAKRNASRLLAPGAIAFTRADLLDGLRSEPVPPSIITANPPYLSDNEYAKLSDSRWAEPKLALAAGADGTDVIRRLTGQAFERLARGGWLAMEVGYDQGRAAERIMKEYGFRSIEVRHDLAGLDRVVLGQR